MRTLASAVQPVSVEDVATLCADAGAADANETFDAAGPETYEEPRDRTSFRTWLDANGDALGRRYMSELGRNFRPYGPL